VGARTPREAGPQGSGTTGLPSGGLAGEGARGRRRIPELWRGTEPQEGSSWDFGSATRADEENPEVVTNDVGGAPEANKALLVGHYKTLKGMGTSRESGRARATVHGLGNRDSRMSLEGPEGNRNEPSP